MARLLPITPSKPNFSSNLRFNSALARLKCWFREAVSATAQDFPPLVGDNPAAQIGIIPGTDMLRTELQGHSVDLGDSGRDSTFGWGLVKELGC